MNLGVRPRLKNFLFRPKPWVMTPRKIRSFSHLCFLGKTSQKKSFFDIPDIKEWFLDQKSEVLKKSKKSNFPTVKILKRNYKEPTFNSCIYLMFALYLLIFLVFIIFIYSKRKNLKNNNTLGHFTLFINVSIKILKITKKKYLIMLAAERKHHNVSKCN